MKKNNFKVLELKSSKNKNTIKRSVLIKDFIINEIIGIHKHEKINKQKIIFNIVIDVNKNTLPDENNISSIVDYEKITNKLENGDIEIAPIAFMRGRTLKNSFAILDEAQNATDIQIKMFLTRIGENSKIVINGDPSQIDLSNKNFSGLNRSKKLLGHLKEISVVDFDHLDVVRHPLVSKIVKAYADQNND